MQRGSVSRMNSVAMAADSTQSELKDKARRHKRRENAPKKKKKKVSKSRKKADSASDCESDLDLEKDLKPIGGYLRDRDSTVEQMFRSISSKKLKAMLPQILKPIPVDDLKKLCIEQLECMSRKRIRQILDGANPDDISSSGTEEDSSLTDDDVKHRVGSSDDEINVADSTSPKDEHEHNSELEVHSEASYRSRSRSQGSSKVISRRSSYESQMLSSNDDLSQDGEDIIEEVVYEEIVLEDGEDLESILRHGSYMQGTRHDRLRTVTSHEVDDDDDDDGDVMVIEREEREIQPEVIDLDDDDDDDDVDHEADDETDDKPARTEQMEGVETTAGELQLGEAAGPREGGAGEATDEPADALKDAADVTMDTEEHQGTEPETLSLLHDVKQSEGGKDSDALTGPGSQAESSDDPSVTPIGDSKKYPDDSQEDPDSETTESTETSKDPPQEEVTSTTYSVNKEHRVSSGSVKCLESQEAIQHSPHSKEMKTGSSGSQKEEPESQVTKSSLEPASPVDLNLEVADDSLLDDLKLQQSPMLDYEEEVSENEEKSIEKMNADDDTNSADKNRTLDQSSSSGKEEEIRSDIKIKSEGLGAQLDPAVRGLVSGAVGDVTMKVEDTISVHSAVSHIKPVCSDVSKIVLTDGDETEEALRRKQKDEALEEGELGTTTEEEEEDVRSLSESEEEDRVAMVPKVYRSSRRVSDERNLLKLHKLQHGKKRRVRVIKRIIKVIRRRPVEQTSTIEPGKKRKASKSNIAENYTAVRIKTEPGLHALTVAKTEPKSPKVKVKQEQRVKSGGSSLNHMEILELEMRARAIKAMLKKQDTDDSVTDKDKTEAKKKKIKLKR